ncbi:MAG: hypothetical protein ACQEQT_04680 [Chloroflexota bacterium]
MLDTCLRGANHDVREGMALEGALARCPRAHTVRADEGAYHRVWEKVVETLLPHTPLLEDDGPGHAYLDARGLGKRESEEAWCRTVSKAVYGRGGLRPRMGVAGGKFAARMAAASCADGRWHVVEGADADYLAPLPVEGLPLSREALRRLRLLGIDTMGAFARLSPTAVAGQFGPQSLRAHRWARGEDRRPLVGRRRRRLEVDCSLNFPENRREPLVQRLLAESAEALEEIRRHHLSVGRVILGVQLDDGRELEGSRWVGKPLGREDLADVLRYLLHGLRGREGNQGVVAVHLTLKGLEPTRRGQLGLFDRAPSRLKLRENLSELRRKYATCHMCRPLALANDIPLVGARYALEELTP